MSILADWQIEALCESAPGQPQPMIDPFECTRADGHNPGQRGRISSGLTSYGYDVTLSRKFQIFQPTYVGHDIIDPKHFNPRLLKTVVDDVCIIPPHSFVLAETVETIEVPRRVLVVILGKSTYARCGLIVNCTPLEPEWRGKVTIEISNTNPLPAKLYAGEGIAQLVFHRADEVCRMSYADKKGRYQNQAGGTGPTV